MLGGPQIGADQARNSAGAVASSSRVAKTGGKGFPAVVGSAVLNEVTQELENGSTSEPATLAVEMSRSSSGVIGPSHQGDAAKAIASYVALSSEGVNDGLISDRLRAVISSVGIYTNTTLSIRAAVR